MKNKELEKHIKNKMLSFTPVVDTDKLWDAVSEQVPSEKKEKGFVYFKQWTAIFISIFLVGFLTYYLGSKKTPNTTNHQNNVLDIKPSLAIKNIKNTSIIPEKSEAVVKTSTLNTSNENRQLSTLKKQESLDNTVGQYRDRDMVLSSDIDNRVMQTTAFSKENSVHKTVTYLDNRGENSNNHISNRNNNRVLSSPNLIISADNNSENKVKEKLISPISNILVLDQIKLKPISRSIEILASTPILYSQTVGSNKNSLIIGFRLGYFEQRMTSLDEESIPYTQFYDKVSATKMSYGLDLTWQYNIYKSWFFQSGISWLNMTSELHPDWSDNTTDISALSGSTSLINTRYEAIGHQYINKIDVPIKLGYYFYHSNGIRLAFNIGPVVNLVHHSFGKTIDNAYRIIPFEKSMFSTRFDLSLSYGIQLEYQLSPQMELYIHPQFNHANIGYGHKEINTNMQFNNYNLGIGLKLKL